MTFEKLDLLLRSVCEGLYGSQGGVYPPPHQEQECIAIATLNLLKLQVSFTNKSIKGIHFENLILGKGSPLRKTLFHCAAVLSADGRHSIGGAGPV